MAQRGRHRKKKKDKESQIKIVFKDDIDILLEQFDLPDPEEVLALMYKEAFRRAKKRRTDYIT